MKKLSEATKRIIIFLIGMSIIQFGVALFLRMNIGSDPFTVFTQGLANTLNNLGVNATTGTANRIILIVLFSIVLLLNKSHIKIGTMICVVGVGPIIDLGISMVSTLPVESYSYLIKMFLIALGCFIIAIGFSILSPILSVGEFLSLYSGYFSSKSCNSFNNWSYNGSVISFSEDLSK